MDHQIIQGDCIETLKTLASESVHCCVTSPPYFGLRDYGVSGQIGLEATPQKFIAAMVTVFEEVRRVLRADGVLFLNLGDSYASNAGGYDVTGSRGNTSNSSISAGTMAAVVQNRKREPASGLKAKDLMLMPHRVAIALQEAGWWVRSDMPWVKRSAMPESVTDRPAKALEYVFLLTKPEKYFWDGEAVRVGRTSDEDANTFRGGAYVGGNTDNGTLGNRTVVGNKHVPGNKTHRGAEAYENGDTAHRTKGGLVTYAQKQRDRSLPTNRNGITEHLDETPAGSRNFRNADLWFSSIKEPHGLVSLGDELVGLDVNPSGFKDAHFATFPPKLIEPLIKAGTSEHGCCADCGSPYERMVSKVGGVINQKAGEYAVAATGGAITGGVQASRLGGGKQTSLSLGWQKTCKCETDERVPCTVLDPFNGAGTTMLVAKRLGRRSIGLELNPEYIKIAEHRLEHWHRSQPPKIEPATAGHGPLFDLMQEVAA